MPTLRWIVSYLDSHKVHYTHETHPLAYTAREVASADHVPEHMMAKTVVFLTQDGYAMAVLPADMYVDMTDLRAALGATRLRLATEPELRDLFPTCELGAMPPFGNGTLYDLPVYMESELAGEESLAFNAGTHRDVIKIRYEDYRGIVKPTVLSFAHRAATANA
jgi:Ala-tRNA(Pro) deacylase